MADVGVDLDCITDITPTMTLASGQRNLGNALARRLTTPRGSLAYAPTYGYDMRALINAPATSAFVFVAQSAIEAECEKDERVDRCLASVEYDVLTQVVTVSIRVTPSAGPDFSLVLGVSKLSTSVLVT